VSEPHRRVWTVVELAAAIKTRLEDSFSNVQVRGEVNALATPASGHVYFSLKDGQALIRCVLYRHIRRYLRTLPVENKEFLVRGNVSAYGPRSEYQIVVDYLEPLGVGALHAAYLELQQRLAARGWFAQERKRPLPPLPEVVGIVTSLAGAALHDMLRIILARRPGQRVVIAPTLVQGDGAAPAIARAIRLLAAHAAPDVIIVGRGGGSPEDLWCWNEEEVVRAVVECPVPVISGVGHEVDVSLCDLAADLRAATPTHAAQLVVPDVAELGRKVVLLRNRARRALDAQRALLRRRLEHAAARLRREAAPTALAGRRLDELRLRLTAFLRRLLTDRRHRLALLARTLEARSPRNRLAERRLRLEAAVPRLHRALLARLAEKQRVAPLAARLARAGSMLVREQRLRFGAVAGRLGDVNPFAVLERGYAIVARADGRIVRAAAETEVGELLAVRLHAGGLKARVEEKT
jgi:exodeoxyribonuclease VII large subunit